MKKAPEGAFFVAGPGPSSLLKFAYGLSDFAV